uniref:Knottins-like domain-containing protein n=1 Tax=Setaria italica TaxID=4555 RepID=K3Z098_SETIT
MEGKITATAMVLLLLTLGAEADRCETHSRTYKGRCNNHNCWSICITEGNTGGFCKGTLLLKCMCTSECNGGGGGPLPPGGASSKMARAHNAGS